MKRTVRLAVPLSGSFIIYSVILARFSRAPALGKAFPFGRLKFPIPHGAATRVNSLERKLGQHDRSNPTHHKPQLLSAKESISVATEVMAKSWMSPDVGFGLPLTSCSLPQTRPLNYEHISMYFSCPYIAQGSGQPSASYSDSIIM